MKNFFLVFMAIMACLSCDNAMMSEIPQSQFIGRWQLAERGILTGVEIEIMKDEKGNYIGNAVKLNDNKYVEMFMEKGDKLISGIKRNSNFKFTISEKKIAAPLFSLYGQSTTKKYEATFEGNDKILIGKNGASGVYLRVKK